MTHPTIARAYDLWCRYFVQNKAPIFSVRRVKVSAGGFIRCRCGNSDGFFWGGFLVTWRKPYSPVWAFDPASRTWVTAYTPRASVQS